MLGATAMPAVKSSIGRWLKSLAGTAHSVPHRLHLVLIRSSRLALSAAILGTCVVAPAHAQVPLTAPPEGATTSATASASPPPASTSDPRPTIGAVAAIGGAVMGVTGAVVFATAPPQTPKAQPTSGSQSNDPPNVPISEPRFGGAGLVGGGIALAAIGLPLYLATSGGAPKPHRNESRMTAGVVLTTIGLAFVGGGAGVLLDATSNRDMPNTLFACVLGCPMLLLGTVVTGVGIPLWVTGAASPTPGSAVRQPFVTKPEVSLGLRSVGLRFQF